MIKNSNKLLNALKKSGIQLIVCVPCINLKELICLVEKSNQIEYISVTREEEGVGICSGYWIGGRKSVLLMQNSGLGNCINGLMSLNRLYNIPIIMIISHRGIENEKMIGQIPMGRVTRFLLDTLNILYYEMSKELNVKEIIDEAFENNQIIAILISPSYWNILL